MYVPKPMGVLLSPKAHETIKQYKSGIATPKQKASKKSLKENAYQTAFLSNNNSYISTPFEC
jgi:hypothetical protein